MQTGLSSVLSLLFENNLAHFNRKNDFQYSSAFNCSKTLTNRITVRQMDFHHVNPTSKSYFPYEEWMKMCVCGWIFPLAICFSETAACFNGNSIPQTGSIHPFSLSAYSHFIGSTLQTVPPECSLPKVETHSLTIMFIFLAETISYFPPQRMDLMEQPLSCHPKVC